MAAPHPARLICAVHHCGVASVIFHPPTATPIRSVPATSALRFMNLPTHPQAVQERRLGEMITELLKRGGSAVRTDTSCSTSRTQVEFSAGLSTSRDWSAYSKIAVGTSSAHAWFAALRRPGAQGTTGKIAMTLVTQLLTYSRTTSAGLSLFDTFTSHSHDISSACKRRSVSLS